MASASSPCISVLSLAPFAFSFALAAGAPFWPLAVMLFAVRSNGMLILGLATLRANAPYKREGSSFPSLLLLWLMRSLTFLRLTTSLTFRQGTPLAVSMLTLRLAANAATLTLTAAFSSLAATATGLTSSSCRARSSLLCITLTGTRCVLPRDLGRKVAAR